jgi:hypothetical protein
MTTGKHRYSAWWSTSILLASVFAAQAAEPADTATRWTPAEHAAFNEGCTLAILTPAQRDYTAAAQRAGNASPRPFPEEALRASIEPMCACIGNRIAERHTVNEMHQGGEALIMPYAQDAMSGGPCKPSGLLGDLISKRPRSGATPDTPHPPPDTSR